MTRSWRRRLAICCGVLAGAVALVTLAGGRNLITALDRGAQKRTMSAMRTIATAVEWYSIDHGGYPVASDLASVAPLLEPAYCADLPLRDGWGQTMGFVSDGVTYAISSRGSDGLWASPALPRRASGAIDPAPTSEIVRGWLRRHGFSSRTAPAPAP